MHSFLTFIHMILEETTVLESMFNTIADLQSGTLLKRESSTEVFFLSLIQDIPRRKNRDLVSGSARKQ